MYISDDLEPVLFTAANDDKQQQVAFGKPPTGRNASLNLPLSAATTGFDYSRLSNQASNRASNPTSSRPQKVSNTASPMMSGRGNSSIADRKAQETYRAEIDSVRQLRWD